MNRDPRLRDQDKRMARCPNTAENGVCMYVGPCLTCSNNRASLSKASINATVTRKISQSQVVTVPADADDQYIIEAADHRGRWAQDGDGTYDIDTTNTTKGSE